MPGKHLAYKQRKNPGCESKCETCNLFSINWVTWFHKEMQTVQHALHTPWHRLIEEKGLHRDFDTERVEALDRWTYSVLGSSSLFLGFFGNKWNWALCLKSRAFFNSWRVEVFAGFLILMNRDVWALILPLSAYPIGSWMSQPYSTVPWSLPIRFSIQIPQAFQDCCSYIKWALLQSNVFTDRIFALHMAWTTLTSNASSHYFRRVIQKGFTT